jgi:serine/threonine protein kinase
VNPRAVGEAPVEGATGCAHCGAALDAGSERCASCRGLSLVAGRYRIGSLVGRGGTSRVYQGRDVVDDANVAIKVVAITDTHDWKALELFERGTRILQSLQHPAVPRVLAFVQDEGRYYQVREFYAAGSLETLVRDGLCFDRASVHFFLRDMLELLSHLHSRLPPVIHRDVKPANIMLHSAGELRPMLVDFDASAADGPQGTGTTIVVSPGYTAPEQLIGDARPASDLYSLGMTAMFLLTHTPPLELPRRGGRIDPTLALAGLEPATRRVIAKLIQPDVEHRYQSAREASNELAGNFVPAARAKVEGSTTKLGFLTQKLEIGGVSLFRIAVGVLLGVLVGYVVLLGASSRRTDTIQQRGMGDRP